ncbi:hypothetical protein JOM56_009082, partial [Amanita muscaria]
FLAAADELFGPITTCRQHGKVIKNIPWLAFKLSESDWARVEDAHVILKDSRDLQHKFSSEKTPTLWNILPAIEELMTAWENKAINPHFAIYADAILDGIAKLFKYYNKFDAKPSIVINLTCHPYYKLDWINLNWGGAKEQAEEQEKGNLGAKNWQDEARKILENMVR